MVSQTEALSTFISIYKTLHQALSFDKRSYSSETFDSFSVFLRKDKLCALWDSISYCGVSGSFNLLFAEG